MSDVAALMAIALMGLITYLTRAGGVWLASIVPATAGMERFLRHLSGSVLAALTVSVVFSADAAQMIGVAIACAAMLLTRSALIALVTGALITSIARMTGVA